MTDKKKENYRKLPDHLYISAGEFLMTGNSVKSDVVPEVNPGGYAIHVPFHITWDHEKITECDIPNGKFVSVGSFKDVPAIFGLKV
jgi:putative hydrolase of the HAD superfamily